MSGSNKFSHDMIEQYVLGQLSREENAQIEANAMEDAELRESIVGLQHGIELLATGQAVTPPAHIKQNIMALIAKADQNERPVILHPASKISDYQKWIDLPEMVRPEDAGPMHIIPFGGDEGYQTALLWLTLGAPEETHTDSIEKFLILEGSCDISFNGNIHSLSVGDYLSIPLHTPHSIVITSSVPCKVLLQRVAA